jgi:tetratricopeptide (TPR) repeat protein
VLFRSIEEALRIDPKYTTALLDRAAIRETRREFDLAAADYETVRKIQPDNRNIDYRVGVLRLYQNRLPEAEEAFDKAVEMSANAADRGVRVYRRGLIRFLRGRYQEAVADFDASLELRTEGKIYPALMRSLALAKLGKPTDTAELAKHIDVRSDKPWLAMVGSIYLGEAPFGEDRAIALAVTPEALCETAFSLGARAWTRGESVNAKAFLKQAVDSDVHIYMEYNLAKILYDRLTKAEENAKKLPDHVGVPPPSGPEPPPTVPLLTDLVETAP